MKHHLLASIAVFIVCSLFGRLAQFAGGASSPRLPAIKKTLTAVGVVLHLIGAAAFAWVAITLLWLGMRYILEHPLHGLVSLASPWIGPGYFIVVVALTLLPAICLLIAWAALLARPGTILNEAHEPSYIIRGIEFGGLLYALGLFGAWGWILTIPFGVVSISAGLAIRSLSEAAL